MASDIFKNIIEQKIDVFASSFGEGATNILKKDDRLIHTLEYGMYKERCARELIEYTTDKSVGIADGFLISTNNNVSTQCDIIMYKKDTLPIIDNGITNFFPVEIVKGIGEVKSTLNITQFKEALLKIAKNKRMFLDRKGNLKTKDIITKEYDEIFSFLICNKLTFDIQTVDFENIYADEPDLRMRHNIILSLQDGFFVYGYDPNDFPPKQKADYVEKRGRLDVGTPIGLPYPHHTALGETYKCIPRFRPVDENDRYKHVKDFLIFLRRLTISQKEHEIDILQYITDNFTNLLEK